MMSSKRNYYFLVAGLPELALEQSKLSFSVSEFLEELEEMLRPEDFDLVRFLFLPYSHKLLLDLALKKNSTPHPFSEWTIEELEEKIKEPGQLPAYMYRFYEAVQQESPIWANLSWENQLTRLYFDHVLDTTCGFLNYWFTFERDLNNILAAWNCRTYELSMDGQLIGDNEVTQALAQSHLRDFGLSNEKNYLDRLLNALENDHLLEREKAIDLIKWDFIDEANTFHYFSIEVVLGYLIKLMILEHRLGLDPVKGEAIVRRELGRLEQAAIKLTQKQD